MNLKLSAIVLLAIFSVHGQANDSDFVIELVSPEQIEESSGELAVSEGWTQDEEPVLKPVAAIPAEGESSVTDAEPISVQAVEALVPEQPIAGMQANQPMEPAAPVECCVICPVNYRPLIEAKFGYFFFADSKMRDVYTKGGVDLQLSGRYPIYKWLEVYGSFEYAQRSGKSLNGNEYTSIWLIPLSLGLQGVAAINDWAEYYVTAGPRYVFVHQHNDSTSVDRVVTENGIGGFANTGFMFYPMKNFVIDFFGEYSYVKMKFHPHHTNVFGRSIQVGGFAFGLGLGYAF